MTASDEVFRQRYVLGASKRGFHRMAFTEWGDPGNDQVVVCAHGLTRNGRDFDVLARALSTHYRVVCPDVVGRGSSDWLADPDDYGYPQYCADMTALIARLDVETITWVGTSMGGLIGMLLAALPGTPVRRLVMNDVGPWIPRAALERIASYVGEDPRFADEDVFARHFRQVYAPFGPLDDAQWATLVASSMRRTVEGDIALNYDPNIAVPFRKAAIGDVDLWPVWRAVDVPVLLLRGELSDVLEAETAGQMVGVDGGRVSFVEFEGVGHAPALMQRAQIAAVTDWLGQHD